MKNEKLNQIILLLWKNAEKQNIATNLNHKSIKDGVYKSEPDEFKKLFISQKNLRVISGNLLSLLNTPELKMLSKISQELKRNNSLWYYDYRETKGRHERTIASLRAKKVIIRTDDPYLHIVNPFAIRFGSLPDVLVCTRLLTMNASSISKKNITHQKPPTAHIENFFTYCAIDDTDTSFFEPFL
jgi:hypothetical protein